MSKESISILRKNRINISKPRKLMLDAFIATRKALDYRYFLYDYPHSYRFERTTVFRILRLFTKKKIVYKVFAGGTYKYLLQQNDKSQSSRFEHSSFICIHCGEAVLLDNNAELKLRLPNGFTRQKMDIIIYGLCPTCKS